MLAGLTLPLPAKSKSAAFGDLSAFVLRSPKTQTMASKMFDLPDPFGPTIAVIPGEKINSVRLAKLLNPKRLKLLSLMVTPQQQSCPLTLLSSRNSSAFPAHPVFSPTLALRSLGLAQPKQEVA
jgi:hypothetical protein